MNRTDNWRAMLAPTLEGSWEVADLINGERRPDFSRPFLPEPFVHASALDFLDDDQRRLLSQIRGRGYVQMCGMFDSFILPFVLDNARRFVNGDGWRVRALLQFAAEEAKHVALFERFRAAFDEGFGSPCRAIGPSDRIGRAVLAHDPLGVALVVLMIESMIQGHFHDTIAPDDTIDPFFKNLLRAHCAEEARHAKIDSLMVEAFAHGRAPAEIAHAVDDFFAIAAMLDAGFAQQIEYDIAAFERAARRTLGAPERDAFRAVQSPALRWTFLWSGMRHPDFVASLDVIGEETRNRITEAAPALC